MKTKLLILLIPLLIISVFVFTLTQEVDTPQDQLLVDLDNYDYATFSAG